MEGSAEWHCSGRGWGEGHCLGSLRIEGLGGRGGHAEVPGSSSGMVPREESCPTASALCLKEAGGHLPGGRRARQQSSRQGGPSVRCLAVPREETPRQSLLDGSEKPFRQNAWVSRTRTHSKIYRKSRGNQRVTSKSQPAEALPGSWENVLVSGGGRCGAWCTAPHGIAGASWNPRLSVMPLLCLGVVASLPDLPRGLSSGLVSLWNQTAF